MGSTETKRCKIMRRVIMFLFIVCAYLLSTTYAIDVIEVNGEETVVSMTALNLVFGTMGSDIPVRSSKIGIIFLILPVLGFFFTFFDKKSNIKNVVSLVCGIIGALSISFMIGAYSGIGAIFSVLLYVIIAFLSVLSIFMNIQDRNTNEQAPRLSPHAK